MLHDHTYICEKGHLDLKPSLGTFERCQHLIEVPGTNGRGWIGCGCPLVAVPFDPSLEAAYKVGGPEAVLSAVRELIADGAPRARGTGGRI
jgi:hypothetical protein